MMIINLQCREFKSPSCVITRVQFSMCAPTFPTHNYVLKSQAGPSLLHGDLWLGNMAVDVDPETGKRGRALCLGASSWCG